MTENASVFFEGNYYLHLTNSSTDLNFAFSVISHVPIQRYDLTLIQ
jgi:hypothetical protein